MSKSVFTIMLRKHGETTGLILFQARAKSRNAVILIMRVQGIVPAYDVLSITERPAREFVLGVLFPRRMQTNNPEIKAAAGKASFWAPVVCWLKRGHDYVNWQTNGRFCRRCKGVFPE